MKKILNSKLVLFLCHPHIKWELYVNFTNMFNYIIKIENENKREKLFLIT